MPPPVLVGLGTCEIGVGQLEAAWLRRRENRQLNPLSPGRRCPRRQIPGESGPDQLTQRHAPLDSRDLCALEQLVRQLQSRPHKSILTYPRLGHSGLAVRHRHRALRECLIGNTVDRLLATEAGRALSHRQTFWYYLPAGAAAYLPWTLVLPAMLRGGAGLRRIAPSDQFPVRGAPLVGLKRVPTAAEPSGVRPCPCSQRAAVSTASTSDSVSSRLRWLTDRQAVLAWRK